MEIDDRVEETLPGTPDREIDRAIWDLVWDGQVSNDTFGPLRNLGRSGSRRRSSRLASVPASTGGRWSLVRRRTPNPTREAVARARLLLERYGVASRSAAAHENVPGGWSTLYKIYRELEEQGQVRRGYFVEGLPGAQFAYAGAVDRLRGARDEAEDRDTPATIDDVRILAVNDPANPYGAQLDWPGTGNPDLAQPRRVSGAWLLLVRGSPALYAARHGRALMSFPATFDQVDGALAAAIEALRRLPRGNRKAAGPAAGQLFGTPCPRVTRSTKLRPSWHRAWPDGQWMR